MKKALYYISVNVFTAAVFTGFCIISFLFSFLLALALNLVVDFMGLIFLGDSEFNAFDAITTMFIIRALTILIASTATYIAYKAISIPAVTKEFIDTLID